MLWSSESWHCIFKCETTLGRMTLKNGIAVNWIRQIGEQQNHASKCRFPFNALVPQLVLILLKKRMGFSNFFATSHMDAHLTNSVASLQIALTLQAVAFPRLCRKPS